MANLPNKPFVFNYNARDYDPATYTIPKTSGQTMDMDMVWTATTTAVRDQIVFDEDHISVPVSAYSLFDFGTLEANPLNNTASAPALTIVAKFKITDNSQGTNFIANRDSSRYNWMFRTGASNITFHTSEQNTEASKVVGYTPSDLTIALVRINGNRRIEIKNLTEGTSNTPFTTTWNNEGTTGFAFFKGSIKPSSLEYMAGDFYWCYVSREVLTDEEIQQVIKYNEGGLNITPDHADFTFTGGTASTVVESETPWTATTTDNWVSFVPTTGASGTTSITITVPKNDFNTRTGKITFTDAEDNTAEFNITQRGIDGLVPNKKLYKGDRRLN